MGINLFISNDLDKLRLKLSEKIKSEPLGVFQHETVLVQTKGIKSRLAVNIAQENKIFANHQFLFPNEFLIKLYRESKLIESNVYDVHNLKWIIYLILDNKAFKAQFGYVYDYFKHDNILRLQLATKLADLFDQYVIYRPDYIKNWNNDIDNFKDGNALYEKWQKWIWTKIKTQYTQGIPDQVDLLDLLMTKLKTDEVLQEKIKKSIPRISVFGLSVFRGFHIDLLINGLKDIIDIDFYMLNPAPQIFWYYDVGEKTKIRQEIKHKTPAEEMLLDVGNQLLMNLGLMGKELFNIIFDYEDMINNSDNDSLVSPPVKRSLLTLIQHEVYNNIPNSKREEISPQLLTDGTVQIASNYSVRREVESLYNYILKQLDTGEYKSNDILIVTNNIDLYTPYIKAVFDNNTANLRYFIADKTYRGNEELIDLLRHLLFLRKEEMTSENVLKILEYQIVRKKFDITDMKAVRELVKMSNIRFGADGNVRDDSIYSSWKYGLERILLGYAMKGGDKVQISDKAYKIKPLDIEDAEMAREGLRLKNFFDKLIAFLENRRVKRPLDKWGEYIINFISEIADIDDKNLEDYNYVIRKLSYDDVLDNFDLKDIPYEVFVQSFFDSVYSENKSDKFISGGITFSTMIPMRSIPFKIIGILGLNSDSFPRMNKFSSFDLMGVRRRIGDRNVKENDKYLFLEYLISAKEKLYLSYIGNNIKDNTEIPPSPVIDELLDYISYKADTKDTEEHLITKHFLNSHNDIYYKDNSKYYTYLYGNKIKNIEPEKERIPDDVDNDNEAYNFSDIKTFYKNPIKWYYNKRLKVYLQDETILLPETEVFELNGLEEYSIKNEIVNAGDYQNLLKHIEDKKIDGELPAGNVGLYTIENIYDTIKPLVDEFARLKNENEQRKQAVEISLDTANIIGEIDNIYGNKVIIVNLSKQKQKGLVLLNLYQWICSIGLPDIEEFVLLHYDKTKKTVTEHKANPLSAEEASEKLQKAIEYFDFGNEKLLPFHSAGSQAYLNTIKKKTRKAAYERFLDTLRKDDYDLYVTKALKESLFDQYYLDEDRDLILEVGALILG